MNWSVSWFVRRSDGGEDQMQVAGEIAIGSYIDAGGGRDQVQTGNGADSIYGGDGEDQIQTGGGNDFVDAGAGNDQVQTTGGHNILLGGAGNDQVQGGNGRDLIVGGTGADKLIGQDNDDILVAGYTDHDGNIANLKAIHAEWLTGASFSTRLNNIKFGGGSTARCCWMTRRCTMTAPPMS